MKEWKSKWKLPYSNGFRGEQIQDPLWGAQEAEVSELAYACFKLDGLFVEGPFWNKLAAKVQGPPES